MTILWEHGLWRWIVRCLKLRNVEWVGWGEYGGRIWVRLQGLSRRKSMVVLQRGWDRRGWHVRGSEMRSAGLVKRVWRDRWRRDKELLYHPFVLFHIGIQMQLWDSLLGWSIPVYKTGRSSACHRSVIGILQSSWWTTTRRSAGAAKERLSKLRL